MKRLNNQQAYLEEAYKLIRSEIIPQAPSDTIVSYGFPKGRQGRFKPIGECWTHPTPENVASVIFISPAQWSTPLDVLHVLAHEMCHAATPGVGHKGPFVKLIRAIGLKGRPTATAPTEELAERLNALAARIGEFPKADFDFMQKTKQSTRLRLYQCNCDPEKAKAEGRTTKIRAATDNLDAICCVCDASFQLVGGKLPGGPE